MCQAVKKCNACFETKPVSEFYFRKDSNTYKGRCKRCTIDGKNMVRSSTHKVCKHCGEEKPFSEYQKAGGGKWLQPYCKPCDSLRKKGWEGSNKEQNRAKRKEYYLKKVKPFIVKKERILKPIEEIRARRLAYSRLPHVKIKKAECDRRYREKNKEAVKRRKKEYYGKYGNEQAKAWQRKQMNNPEFRIKKNLRGRIYVALKREVKSDSTMALLGCTIEEFRKYFESLFTKGMNWEKYLEGGIHIDHIIPCKFFDLSDPAQQKKCFHYTNLQPLWGLDNLRKGASLNYKKVA